MLNEDNAKVDIPKTYAIITDPPYGINNNCDYTRFTRGLAPARNHHRGIPGDDQPFNPARWLQHKRCLMFGYQYFAQHLPVGSIFVWNKKRPNQLNKFMSDCELAWSNKGKGCYLFNHVWCGFDRQTERGEKTLHPTQKPVALFEWLITQLKIPQDVTICDPYMGSGSVGVASVNLGYSFVGVEIDEQYFSIAKSRIESAHNRAIEKGEFPVVTAGTI